MFRTPTKEEVEQEMARDFSKEDPWHFKSSAHEMKRFKTMLGFIKSIPHASILEVGCAEGFFTKMLAEVCDSVTAIDISEVAISRARLKAPKATYIRTSLEDFETDRKFDLIICSEVIYYTYNRKKVIDKIKQLGIYMVASNIMLNGLRPCSAEFIFRSLSFPEFKFLFSLKEMKLSIVTLRKLANV